MKWLNKIMSFLVELPFLWIKEVKNIRQKRSFDKIWQKAWLEENYADAENIQIVAEHYREFDNNSVDFLLYFFFLPIGTVRLILNDPVTSIPVIRDFKIKGDWQDKKVLEITLLTVNQSFRKHSRIASLLLMRQFYRYAKQNNYSSALIAADKRLFVLLKRICVVEQIGEGKIYEGSLTIPALIDVNAQEEAWRTKNKKLYQFFIKERL